LLENPKQGKRWDKVQIKSLN